jgi:hypothetical protein
MNDHTRGLSAEKMQATPRERMVEICLIWSSTRNRLTKLELGSKLSTRLFRLLFHLPIVGRRHVKSKITTEYCVNVYQFHYRGTKL